MRSFRERRGPHCATGMVLPVAMMVPVVVAVRVPMMMRVALTVLSMTVCVAVSVVMHVCVHVPMSMTVMAVVDAVAAVPELVMAAVPVVVRVILVFPLLTDCAIVPGMRRTFLGVRSIFQRCRKSSIVVLRAPRSQWMRFGTVRRQVNEHGSIAAAAFVGAPISLASRNHGPLLRRQRHRTQRGPRLSIFAVFSSPQVQSQGLRHVLQFAVDPANFARQCGVGFAPPGTDLALASAPALVLCAQPVPETLGLALHQIQIVVRQVPQRVAVAVVTLLQTIVVRRGRHDRCRSQRPAPQHPGDHHQFPEAELFQEGVVTARPDAGRVPRIVDVPPALSHQSLVLFVAAEESDEVRVGLLLPLGPLRLTAAAQAPGNVGEHGGFVAPDEASSVAPAVCNARVMQPRLHNVVLESLPSAVLLLPCRHSEAVDA